MSDLAERRRAKRIDHLDPSRAGDALGAWVCEEMRARVLSPADVAELTGGAVSREQVSYWINGRRSLPSDKAAVVLIALGLLRER